MGKAGRQAGQVHAGHKRQKTEAAAEAGEDNEACSMSALLTPALHDELRSVWHETAEDTACKPSPADTHRGGDDDDEMKCVPSFKVGRQELYKRFAGAYDVFMRHHNCDALRAHLLHDIIGRITRSAENNTSSSTSTSMSLHVADFGCGTGRMGEMLLSDAPVAVLYAYDGAPAMLQRCLVNLVRAAKRAGRYDAVVLQPEAACASSSSSSSPAVCLVSQFSSSSQPDGHTLRLCVRPCSFAAVQAGVLSRSRRHPPCQLVVCAWALSYVMREQWGEDRWHAAVDAVVRELAALLDTRSSDAALVIVETLGNGAAGPTRRNTLMERLEQTHGFVRHWLHTDYEFTSVDQAAHMLRFFFGGKAAAAVREAGATVWPECTGVWTLWRPRQASAV